MAPSLGERLLGALGKALRDTVKYQVDKYTKPKRRRSTTRRRSTSKRRTTSRTTSKSRSTSRTTSRKSSSGRNSTSTTGRARRTTPRRLAEVGAFVEGYPGDFQGVVQVTYSPQPGATADPGEVVWTWVPYEEDHSQGKDRPVLLIGRDGAWLLGLPLTSKDHDRDQDQEAREGRHWVDVGSGAWDSRGRPSEARVDRVVRVDEADVRREGGVLERTVFDRVAAAVQQFSGGSE